MLDFFFSTPVGQWFIQIRDMLAGVEVANVDARFLFYIGIFMGILLLWEGLRQVLSRRENQQEASSRRMKLIKSGKSVEEVLSILKPEAKADIYSRLPFVGDLRQLLLHAGMTIGPSTFVFACLIGFVLAFFVSLTFTTAMMAGVIGFSLFIFLPIVLVRNSAEKRMDKFTKQLPDALDLMARGLKVGHPLNTTLASVANEMPDPIGTQFGIVVDQVSYGEELTDAIQELAERIDQEDVRYLAASVSIQHGTGGDLARVLNTLAKVIRARITMRRRIKAISAEGRMSAVVLSIIPVFIFAFTMITNPAYYLDIKDDPLAMPVAFLVVFFVVANAIALRKLVNFRI